MARRRRRIIDYTDRTVRLTDERLGHIREHPEMIGQERRIREVLQSLTLFPVGAGSRVDRGK